MILDNCIQSLLHMKDSECLNITNIQIIATKMMDELTENRREDINTSMDFINSENEVDMTNLSDNNSIFSPNLNNE